MSYGQEIKSWLLCGFTTFLHKIIGESWSFVVLENQKWLESLVLSGFTFSVFGWTPRGYYQQLPVDCLGALLLQLHPKILLIEALPFDCLSVWTIVSTHSTLALPISSLTPPSFSRRKYKLSQCLWLLSSQLKALLSVDWYSIITFINVLDQGSKNFFHKGPDI